MLERMDEFFNVRAQEYDVRQVQNIGPGAEGYERVADYLPAFTRSLLDLGCGTGLELKAIFKKLPRVKVTGIDFARDMLQKLREKYPEKEVELICGSYFDVEFGENRYDAAVSVETLHHFTHGEKTGLYKKLCRALKENGVYVECDYMAPDQAYEDFYFAENRRIRTEQGITEGFFHYDTPCTVENQIKMLLGAGFCMVEKVWQAENTVILMAKKSPQGELCR